LTQIVQTIVQQSRTSKRPREHLQLGFDHLTKAQEALSSAQFQVCLQQLLQALHGTRKNPASSLTGNRESSSTSPAKRRYEDEYPNERNNKKAVKDPIQWILPEDGDDQQIHVDLDQMEINTEEEEPEIKEGDLGNWS
jgi:hypothetical protein